jgi:hypothetical protein
VNAVRRERRWINEHHRDPQVKAWLRDHPPPPEWEGSPLQWAYTEMPQPTTGMIVGLGLIGVAGLAWWLFSRKQRRLLIAGATQGQQLTRVPRCREGEVLDQRRMICVPRR